MQTVQIICQVVMLFLLALGVFLSLHKDFNGVAAKKPGGFNGAVGTIIVLVVTFLLQFFAGAFCRIF